VCSIQLSYGDIFDFSWSRMERSASQDFDDLIIRRILFYPLNYGGTIDAAAMFILPQIAPFVKRIAEFFRVPGFDGPQLHTGQFSPAKNREFCRSFA